MTRFSVLLSGALASCLCTAALAQEPALKRVQTSFALFQMGVDEAEPLYILAAAQLRKSVSLTAGTLAPEGTSVAPALPLLDANAMLAAAAPLIAGDPALEGLAEDIRAARSKGVATGPVYSIVKIKGKGRDVYPSITFSGGKYAEIYVEGASGTDLNLMIHDAKKRLVCSDTDISAVAYCGWHPKQNDTYSITVVNQSARSGRYSLMSN